MWFENPKSLLFLSVLKNRVSLVKHIGSLGSGSYLEGLETQSFSFLRCSTSKSRCLLDSKSSDGSPSSLP